MSSNESKAALRAKRSGSKKVQSAKNERAAARYHGVVLRTPLLPVETMDRWSEGTAASRAWAEGGDLESALEGDLVMLRQRLASIVRRPEVREAIHLAAPAVAAGIDVWLAQPTSKQGRDLERSLTRYATRMCTRATPFGLFSGISVGTAGERTRAELAAGPEYRRSVSLDADGIGAMVARLVEAPGGWARARLYTNTTLAEIDGGYHYAEWRDGGSGRSYDLSRLPMAPPLRAVVERARDGATTSQLVAVLREHVEDLEDDEALAFLEELVVNKILTSELEPAVTGLSPTDGFAKALAQSHPEQAEALTKARAQLDELNARPLGAAPEEYDAIRAALGDLLAEDHRQWLHGKLYKPTTELTLGPDVTEQLEAAIGALERLAAPTKPLGDFAARFEARYEGRAVPLLEVLDPDGGIGFGVAGRDATPLLDGLPLGRVSTARSKSMGLLEQRLATVLRRHDASEAMELDLSGKRLAELVADLPTATDPGGTQSFAAMFTLAEPAHEGASPELILGVSGGATGSALLGRFCHSDPAMEDLVRRNLAAEEADAQVIYAEIAHSPEGRHANVIARPVLRGYEIPYLGRSGAPPQQQIRVSDLDVAVRQGSVVLRSRRLNREVVPRLTCAHSAAGSSLPVYRFLAALATVDACPSASWSWGAVLPTLFDFLPRVRIAGVVVSLAMWSCRREEVEGLQSPDIARRFAAVQALRKRRGLPRWVSHGVSDRLVVIDLDNCLCIDALAHAVRDQDRFELTEVYPEPARCFARGPEGRFAGEMIVPTTREVGAPRRPRIGSQSAPTVVRSFAPGSEWLYARLYSSCAGVDRLVQQLVGPLMKSAQASGLIEDWFFIRFGDPDWHVRLRAHGDPGRLQRDLLPALQEALSRRGGSVSCWKTELGTYEREVERYGGSAGIELAEAIFHRDSVHATACLTAVGNDASLRWQATLAGLDATLASLGLDLEGRLEVVTLACTSMASEFSLGKVTDKKLSKRFREHRSVIEGALSSDPTSQLGPDVAASLSELRATLRPIGKQYELREQAGLLQGSLIGIGVSLIHMHANRMFRSDARPQEYVLYDFLRRYYRSAIARIKKHSARRLATTR